MVGAWFTELSALPTVLSHNASAVSARSGQEDEGAILMEPLSVDCAQGVLVTFGVIGLIYVMAWAYANLDESRVAWWIVRVLVWMLGLLAGYVLGWAIWSLVVA